MLFLISARAGLGAGFWQIERSAAVWYTVHMIKAALGILFLIALVTVVYVLLPNEAIAPQPDNTGAVPSVTEEKEQNIRVFSPKPDDEVGMPLVIRGEARVFENMFAYRLRDADGSVLFEDSAYAHSSDAGLYGSFIIETGYPAPKGATGSIEVFDRSAKDGAEIDVVRVPVRFRSDVESMTVAIFFGNTIKDPKVMDCKKVFPVERRIPKTQGAARAAVEELLAGVKKLEADQGYFSSINEGAKLQKIIIRDGIAYADFDEALQRGVGGSCRVTAIAAQITETLKQFPAVKGVKISIDGRTEDILQP
jgi:hypothetical protein